MGRRMVVGLSAGEGWWLARRRAGETQAVAARRLAVSVDRLADWEWDRGVVPSPLRRGNGAALREGLSDGEFLALVRRRKGWSANRAARWAGVSRLTYLKAEADRTSSARRFALRASRGAIPGASAAPLLRLPAPSL